MLLFLDNDELTIDFNLVFFFDQSMMDHQFVVRPENFSSSYPTQNMHNAKKEPYLPTGMQRNRSLSVEVFEHGCL